MKWVVWINNICGKLKFWNYIINWESIPRKMWVNKSKIEKMHTCIPWNNIPNFITLYTVLSNYEWN